MTARNVKFRPLRMSSHPNDCLLKLTWTTAWPATSVLKLTAVKRPRELETNAETLRFAQSDPFCQNSNEMFCTPTHGTRLMSCRGIASNGAPEGNPGL